MTVRSIIADGTIFGHWTVLNESFEKKVQNRYMSCRCVCGVIKDVQLQHLKSGASTNCGCKKVGNTKIGARGRDRQIEKARIKEIMIRDAGEKECVSCHVIKPLSEFWESIEHANGNPACKECGKEELRLRHAAKPRRPVKEGKKRIGVDGRPLKPYDAGLRFNRLVIVQEVERQGKRRYFETRCDCGKRFFVLLQNLKNGNTKSCGCLAKEVASDTASANNEKRWSAYKEVSTRQQSAEPSQPDSAAVATVPLAGFLSTTGEKL